MSDERGSLVADYIDIRAGMRLYLSAPEDPFGPRFVADVRGVSDAGIRTTAAVRDTHVLTSSVGQALTCFIALAGRQFRFDSRVIEVDGSPAASLLLAHPERAEKIERREFYRVMTRIEPQVAARYDEDGELVVLSDALLLDISGGGARLRTATPPRAGERIHLGFRLDDDPHPVALDATVLRLVPPEQGRRFFQVHCQWIDLPPALREQIVRFVFRQQVAENQRRAS
jgi:c-di-GMP-binding flagellar brake protein YcgR